MTLNHFPKPDPNKTYFFGLRGALPVDDDDHREGRSADLTPTEIDHRHPRCTIGQWMPGKSFRLFCGSTVPHRKYIGNAIRKGGSGANQLMTGYIKDFRKGKHKPGKSTGHDAFRQVNKLPIRRTADDFDYENDDRVEFMAPFDNLHAAWSQGTSHATYASAGCQVVCGYPKCSKLGNRPEVGPWATFIKRAYELSQNSFDYILLNGRDALKVAEAGDTKLSARLRYGSQGKLVKKMQEKLRKEDFYEGTIDGDFGPRSLFAVLHFQEARFGDEADDGVVGPLTADGLGMEWERV